MNAPLAKEIEDALADKHVICFLKFDDRCSRGSIVRHYSVVRLYTEEEVQACHEAEDLASILEDVHDTSVVEFPSIGTTKHVVSSSSRRQMTAEKEFFTTTKAVLEEILEIEPTAHLLMISHLVPRECYLFPMWSTLKNWIQDHHKLLLVNSLRPTMFLKQIYNPPVCWTPRHQKRARERMLDYFLVFCVSVMVVDYAV